MKFIVILLIVALVLAPIPYVLIWTQAPQGRALAASDLDFDSILGQAAAEPLPEELVEMRDGTPLRVRHVEAEGKPLLVLLHGSGWYSAQFDTLIRRLEGRAEIVAPDLRGHGANPERRGDVDYIGQLEDDVADLIDFYAAPGQKVVLAGHSSGGGLAVRFAGGAHGDKIDRAVLLAPFLKYDAPTTRPNSGGWAHPLSRRIIAISILNQLGITSQNDKIVIEFSFPEKVLDGPEGDKATTAYTYRMNTSFAPRSDYLADVAALPDFLLVAGENDQAFVAEGYEPLMSDVTDRGSYMIVPGAGHLDLVDRPETAEAISGVLDGL